MEMRRVTIALSFAGLASLGTAMAAEGPETKAAPPAGIYLGVVTPERFDISPPLRSIPPVQPMSYVEKGDDERNTGLEGPLGFQDVDMSVQTRVGTSAEIPGPNIAFDGFSNMCGCSPPDPVGDVGPNHYVVMANLHFAVYNKAGGVLFGPVPNNTLWAGFGGPCQTQNAGDPIVLYDQMADRWILTQFTATGPTYFNCVAVSQTPDPTGSYFRYAFSNGNNFPDYPKYGVWPDAYYISTRNFLNGASFSGVGALAINRAQALVGNPATQLIPFVVPPGGTPYNIGDGLLPTDLDGSTLPPVGSPNYFLGTMDQGGPYGAPQDAITLWKFTADFANPPASSFTLTNTIPVNVFDSIFPCTPGSRDCIPQPGTTQKLDILSYRQRPLHRAAYRNFGTHESIVTNQSVEAAPSMAGIRWYELRSPNVSPTIFQQGTYAPGVTDGIHRWMGSIAMDRAGNMALGYSAADDNSPAGGTFPGVRFTGRLAADPLGTMPQGEGIMGTGTGSQVGSPRWGDYTSMNVDSVDDCTFWFVNEYYVTTGSSWRIRVGQFQFPAPQCVPVPVALQGFSIE